MENDKVTSSYRMDTGLKERIRRLSNILNQSESTFLEDAVGFYIDKSNIGKQALKKITENERYLKGIERAKIANAKHYGSGTIIGEHSMK